MRLTFTLIVLSLCSTLWAQQTGTIRGTIKDKNTAEILIGATIQIEGTTLGAASDVNGTYKISNIPVGSYTLKANLIGYEAQSKFNIAVSSGNDQVINFELNETKTDLK